MEKDKEERAEFQRKKMERAFAFLTNFDMGGGLEREQMDAVFKELNHHIYHSPNER